VNKDYQCFTCTYLLTYISGQSSLFQYATRSLSHPIVSRGNRADELLIAKLAHAARLLASDRGGFRGDWLGAWQRAIRGNRPRDGAFTAPR